MKHILDILIMYCLCFIVVMTTSCNKNMEQMAMDYQSGVVLIQTIEYYEMELGDGSSIYFTGSDFDKETKEFLGLSTDLYSLTPDEFYGTGFFISEDGKIATNRHVVEGNITEKEAKEGLRKLINAIEEEVEKEKEEYTYYKNETTSILVQEIMKDSNPEIILAEKDALEFFNQRLELIDILIAQLKQINPLYLHYENIIRIGYNNTFITTTDELKLCEIRAVSDTDDLAIIQLHDKRTPEGRHVFELTQKDMIQHYSYGEFLMHIIDKDKNEKLMMIGYNKGPEGGITKEGLNAQHTMGSVSRYMESARDFEYDIPALDGASGSPVLNRRGQVVGINYAGAQLSNSFNYAIKEKYLFDLKQTIE